MDEVTKKMMKMVEDQKERNVSMRCNRVLIKAKKIEQQGKNLMQLVTNYPVKVADSCPLAIEQQRLQQLQKPHSQQETEAIRLQKMKKQAFLEKISRELKDK